MRKEIVDELHIWNNSTILSNVEGGIAPWNVLIQLNNGPIQSISPYPDNEDLWTSFGSHFKEYFKLCAETLHTLEEVDKPRLSELHKRVEEYVNGLFNSLNLGSDNELNSKLKKGSTKCKIIVNQIDPIFDRGAGYSEDPTSRSIHFIHWELLEHYNLSGNVRSVYQFQVCRVLSLKKVLSPTKAQSTLSMFPKRGSSFRKQERSGSFYEGDLRKEAKEPISSVAADSTQTYKVLIVLARQLVPKNQDWREGGGEYEEEEELRYQDEALNDEVEDHGGWAVKKGAKQGHGHSHTPELDSLGQLPLTNIQHILDNRGDRHRLKLDIIRPGSLAELRNHLKRKSNLKQPVKYNIVHFDLHGRIEKRKRDQNGVYLPPENQKQVVGLQFAESCTSSDSKDSKIIKAVHLKFASAEDIAKVLKKYEIENVVLNSCVSAYPLFGRNKNMCEVLLKRSSDDAESRGLKSVLGMWGKANEVTTPEFLEKFYHHLLVESKDFETAVFLGREALRKDKDRWPERAYADDFICVQYLRGPPPRTAEAQPLVRQGTFSWIRRNLASYDTLFKRPHRPLIRSRSIQPPGARPVYNPVRLEILHLKLEMCMMLYQYVWVQGDYSSDDDQQQFKSLMRNLGHLWWKTGFISQMKVYSAARFKSRNIPQPSLQLPEQTGNATKKLYIIEDVDYVFGSIGGDAQEERELSMARNYFREFLRLLPEEDTLIALLTGKGKKWCERQNNMPWMGNKSAYWWSFNQDIGMNMFADYKVTK